MNMLRLGTTLLLTTSASTTTSSALRFGAAAASLSSSSPRTLFASAAASVASAQSIASSSLSPHSRQHPGGIIAPITAMAAAASAADVPHTADKPAQKWDVDRYQKSHSFVWKYGASLLELVDYDKLSSLVATKKENDKQGGPAPILRALDVGCGSGQLTRLLRDELASRTGLHDDNVHVFGMDLDPDMIQAAQNQHPNVRFFVGDARTVQLPPFDAANAPSYDEASSSSVHLVLSNAALHWIPPSDIDRAVQSISQVLLPGGQFVVEFGGRGNVKTIVKAMKHVFQTPPATVTSNHDGVDGTCSSRYYYGDDHVDSWYYPSIADFAGRLASSNIEVTSAALFDRPTLLDNGELGMENWIRMFGSKYWRHLNLTAAELDDKIQQAVELLRPDLYDPSTRQWTADYRRIRIVGRKLSVD